MSYVEYALHALFELEKRTLRTLLTSEKRLDRRMDGWTPDQNITISAKRGQHSET